MSIGEVKKARFQSDLVKAGLFVDGFFRELSFRSCCFSCKIYSVLSNKDDGLGREDELATAAQHLATPFPTQSQFSASDSVSWVPHPP